MLVWSTLSFLPTLHLAYSNSPFRSEIKYPVLQQATLAHHAQVASHGNCTWVPNTYHTLLLSPVCLCFILDHKFCRSRNSVCVFPPGQKKC